jgi:hypothetical protein
MNDENGVRRETGVSGELVAIANFRHESPNLFARVCATSALPVVERRHARGFRYLIDCADDRLQMIDMGKPSSAPFRIDHDSSPRAFKGVDILRRALGRRSRSVIDSTAGFGYDAVHIARLGLRVVAIERCEPIALLLGDALHKLSDPDLRSRIVVIAGDSMDRLVNLEADVVYLDPMFVTGEGSRSLPRRRMVLARELAGEDQDAGRLLALARERFRRIVVKRPDKYPPLSPGVHHSHGGKTVRYDVYINDSVEHPSHLRSGKVDLPSD